MTSLTNIKTISILAEDTNSHKKCIINKKIHNDMNENASKTAGLERVLQIGINSKVILRRNLDVSKGLCNGSMEIVTGISQNKNGYVNHLFVQFNNDNSSTKIERFCAKFQKRKNAYVNRKQFPLQLAWAITIHKSQGLTLKCIMIDLGESVFSAGMAYVGLSRCRSLENVYLMKFDPSNLKCMINPINEYNR